MVRRLALTLSVPTFFSAALVAVSLAAVDGIGTAGGGNSLRVTGRELGGDVLIVGRYHITNPSYCLPKKPSYGAPNYDRWLSKQCVPYTVQRARFSVTVRYRGRRVYSDAFSIDGAYGDPTQGGTFTPYYIYCGLMASHPLAGSTQRYHWSLLLIDPFHRRGYNVSRYGTFDCG